MRLKRVRYENLLIFLCRSLSLSHSLSLSCTRTQAHTHTHTHTHTRTHAHTLAHRESTFSLYVKQQHTPGLNFETRFSRDHLVRVEQLSVQQWINFTKCLRLCPKSWCLSNLSKERLLVQLTNDQKNLYFTKKILLESLTFLKNFKKIFLLLMRCLTLRFLFFTIGTNFNKSWFFNFL